MTRARGIIIAAACMAAALGLSLLAPDDEVTQSPYVTTIAGEHAATKTRQLVVAVTGVRLADRVQTPDWTGETTGVWLIVDLEFSRRIDVGGIKAIFRVGDTDYAISERTDSATIDYVTAQPDLPWSGAVLVELPLAALSAPAAKNAVMRFAASAGPLGGGELDGALDYVVDLTSLTRERSVTLTEPQRISPAEAAK